MPAAQPAPCACAARPDWARIVDDEPLTWPVVESGEWEELRECPGCGRRWLCSWPDEREGLAILCRPRPETVRRLLDLDRGETLRGFVLSTLQERSGDLTETKLRCIKQGCERRRVRGGGSYCLEHLIAQRFGRQMSRLGRDSEDGADDGGL